MALLFATIFVSLAVVFGLFLMFARPENIERPFMVGGLTTATSLISGWLLWLQWQEGDTTRSGSAIAFALFAMAGFAIGRAIDVAMGPRTMTADERQATLGAELAD